VSKGRLEAFSDGVIAVAATLLVLNITVPDPATHPHLGHALAQMWPSYVAYATSFLTIGIIWVNHHAMIGRLRQPDHVILVINLGLLLWIGVLPFATNLMQGQGDHLAAAVYSGSFLAMAITFAALNHHILYTKSHLLSVTMTDERRRQVIVRSVIGVVPYTFATAIAPLSAYATLAICTALAGYYALPIASGGSDQS
jgi:TMEM175 potassium channel family protein